MPIHAGLSRAPAAPSAARLVRARVPATSRPLRRALALTVALAFAPSQPALAWIWIFTPSAGFTSKAPCAAKFCNDGSLGIYGGDGVVMNGAGGLSLEDNYTYTGGTWVDNGVLWIGVGGTKGSLFGNLMINGLNAEVRLARTDDFTLAANISGRGKVVKYNANTLTLTGALSYTGATEIGRGAVNFSTASNQVLQGAITGSGGLIKSGAGSLTVADLRSYTGKTTIDEGTLIFNYGQSQTVQGDITGGGNLASQSAFGRLLTLAGVNSYTGTTSIGNGGLKFDSAQDQKLAGAVTGTGPLIKAGSGTLTLAAVNAYSGTTTIDGGTLAFTSQADQTLLGSISGAGNLTKAGAGTLTLQGQYSLTGQTTIETGTLTVDAASSTANLIGVLAGGGNLTKAGAGTLVLGGANGQFRGITTVSDGTLQFTATQSLYGGLPNLWTANRLVVQPGATAAFNVGSQATEFKASDLNVLKSLGSATGGFQSGSFLGLNTSNATSGFEYAGAIADTNAGANVLGLQKLGANTLILSGNNTYSGGTQVLAGTLQIGNGGTTGAIRGDVLNHATLAFNPGGDASFSGVISGTGNLVKAGSGVLTLGGTARYSGTTTITAGTLAFAADADQTLSGAITGNGHLAKSGTGTLTLDGANTYWGKTSVQAGTLELGGGLDGTTEVSVAAGARLATRSDLVQIKLRGVSGQPGGNVALDGVLAPNNASAGTLILNLANGSKLNWGQGAHLEFDLGSSQDLISFDQTGHWLAGSGLATLDLNVGNAGFDYAHAYTLFHGVLADGFSFAGITGYDSAHYRAALFQVGEDLNIGFSAVAVPEPQTYALLLAGLAVMGGWSRKRMRDRAEV